jgi:ADP-ribosylglycohydrolase
MTGNLLRQIKGTLFGMTVGDALGVPVEFKSRIDLKGEPVTGMTGYGKWDQPPGTWSDDSGLGLCLAESLTRGYDLNDIASNFLRWYNDGYWGAHHKPFEVGGTTRNAFTRLMNGVSPALAGGVLETENGNGALMRILPLLFHIHDLDIETRYVKIKEVSSITHAHFRSVTGCFIYLEMARLILKGYTAHNAYSEMKTIVNSFCENKKFDSHELSFFDRVLKNDIDKLEESAIDSRGNVVTTLEASLWCVLTRTNYTGTVLTAVNLGDDTDTTACVAGGMAGLLYGYNAIPAEWIHVLARNNDIEDLCKRLNSKITGEN